MIFENEVIEVSRVQYNQITPKKSVMLDGKVKVTNPYVQSLIINSNLITDNFKIISVTNNEIHLSRWIMSFRKEAKQFLSKARDYNPTLMLNRTCECTYEGSKAFNYDDISIKALWKLKELEEKELDANINIEIFDGGFNFHIVKRIKEDKCQL